MFRTLLSSVVAIPVLLTSVAHAEQPSAEYIEYRSQPELGRISITDCSARGEKAVDHLVKDRVKLAKTGVFVCGEDKKRQFHRRTEKVAGRKVNVMVVVDPAAPDPKPDAKGEKPDEEAPSPTQHLLVVVDGRQKVNCTIGTSADGELWVHEVIIHPEDGTLEIHALSSDGNELTLPEEWVRLDDATVITDDSFFEDEPAESGNAPVKV